MKVNQLKLGSILSYVQIFVSIIIGLLYTPIMLNVLGQSEYGLYNVAASTISLLSVLGLGLTSSYVRFFAEYKQRGDEQSIYKLNGLFFIVLFIIGIIAFICGFIIANNLNYVFDEGLSAAEYFKARILMMILAVNLAVSFPASVFTCIITANERFVFLKLLGLIKSIAGPLVNIPVLLMGYGSIGIVVSTLCASFFIDCIYIYYVFFVLKQKFIFKQFEKKIFKRILIYTAFIAINMIVNEINSQIDKLLLGRYQGTKEVAIYSVGFTIISYYMMFSTSISGVLSPRIHSIVCSNGDDLAVQGKELTSIFIKVGRIQFALLSLICTGFIFFGKDFITKYWAGAGYDNSYYVAILLMVSISIALIQNVGIEIQRAQNKHYFRSIVYLIMALGNLGISIVLCQKYGAIGCTIGTAISYIVANGIIMNFYYHKKCNINILSFWKSILSMSKALIVPVVFGVIISFLPLPSNVWFFLVEILVYSVVFILFMWLLGFNKEEKEIISSFFRKIKKKKV